MQVPVGDRIREARLRAGLTQTALCEGICTKGTLSRIENDEQIPRMKMLKQLLERLGDSSGSLLGGMLESERAFTLNANIALKYLEQGQLSYIEKFLEDTALEEAPPYQLQMCHYMQAMYLEAKKEDTSMILKELTMALGQSRSIEDIYNLSPDRLYYAFEIVIMDAIARQHLYRGETICAGQIWYGLCRYLNRQSTDGVLKNNLEPAVINNYANLLLAKNDLLVAYKYVNEGIKKCFQYGSLDFLPTLLLTEMQIADRLGNGQNVIEDYELWRDLKRRNLNTDPIISLREALNEDTLIRPLLVV